MAKYAGKDLSLTIDGTEVNVDATSIVLEHEEADSDAVTFAELASGSGVVWYFTINAVSDYGAGLWRQLWDNAGSDVAFVFDPYGVGPTPTATQPHFIGTATITTKPPVGGTAGETFMFETRLDVVGQPEMDDGTAA